MLAPQFGTVFHSPKPVITIPLTFPVPRTP